MSQRDHRDQGGCSSAMTLQPGDRVRLTPEHAAVRSASPRTRKDWAIRIGVVDKIRRHWGWAYVIWETTDTRTKSRFACWRRWKDQGNAGRSFLLLYPHGLGRWEENKT